MLLDGKMYKDRLYSFFDGCVKYKYINIRNINTSIYQYKYISNIIK